MTRGNQREKAREKAQKKQKEMDKKKDSSKKGGNAGKKLEERRERDAAIMREKQLKKEEDGQGATGGASKWHAGGPSLTDHLPSSLSSASGLSSLSASSIALRHHAPYVLDPLLCFTPLLCCPSSGLSPCKMYGLTTPRWSRLDRLAVSWPLIRVRAAETGFKLGVPQPKVPCPILSFVNGIVENIDENWDWCYCLLTDQRFEPSGKKWHKSNAISNDLCCFSWPPEKCISIYAHACS